MLESANNFDPLRSCNLYQFVLVLHNLLRWFVVLFAVLALLKALQGWLGKKEWSASDKSIGMLFTISMDTQILLGILLYVGLSPLMKLVWSDFSAAMQNNELRFFAVEHLPYMILAAIAAHIGYRAGKADIEAARKQRAASIWYAAAILFLVIGMPWFRPFLPF